VVETIRAARQELLDANNALASALEIAQRAFGFLTPCRCAVSATSRNAGRRKPKQIVGDGKLNDFLQYVSVFREEAKACSWRKRTKMILLPRWSQRTSRRSPRRRGAADDGPRRQGIGIPARVRCANRVPAFPVDTKNRSSSFRGSCETVTLPKLIQDPARSGRAPALLRAMTRAMDELYLCGKAGSEKKQPYLEGYMRDLVAHANAVLRGAIEWRLLRLRRTSPKSTPLLPHLNPPSRNGQGSRLVRMPAGVERQLASGLRNCPLKYKCVMTALPEDASAPLQFGSAMHLALKAYFDGVRAGVRWTSGA